MANKEKDFSAMNTSQLFSTLATATSRRGQQGTASPAEAADRAAELRTQGRKGCKATRINMAFTPENHEFIKIMARASGKTMTELTNQIIKAYRNEHPELIGQAQQFLDTINSGAFSKISDDE